MSRPTVNPELYDFLKEYEIHLSITNAEEVISCAFIDFSSLQELVRIVGSGALDDGGVDCKLQDGNICIDVLTFIEYEGDLISSYKNCFDEESWNDCKEKILEMERE